MKKTIMKVLTVIALLMLSISLAACTKNENGGGTGGKGNNGTKTEVKEDRIGFVSTFEKLDIDISEAGYITEANIDGDNFSFVEVVYENNDFSKRKTTYHTYNLLTKEDSFFELEKELFGENSSLQSISKKKDGGFYLVLSTYDMNTYQQNYMVVTMNENGEVLGSFSLIDFITAEDSYLYDTVFSDDGTLYLITSSRVIAVEISSGRELFALSLDGWVNNFFMGADGTLYVSVYSMTDGTMKIVPVEKEKKAFGAPLDLASESLNEQFYQLGEGKLFLSSDTEAKSYDIAKGELKNLWNWFEIDMAENYLDSISQDKDGTFHIIYTEWDDKTGKETIWHVTVKEELIPADKQKDNILFGCGYLNWDVKKAIGDFNKLNSQYRVIPYAIENTSDYELAYNQFEEDIIAGKYDIIDTSSVDYVKLAKKGAFVDLYQYMNNDSDIKLENYFSNLFKASEINGKLYTVSPFVQISTMMVDKSLVGNKEKITLSDLLNFRKQYPNIAFMDYGTKEEAFYVGLLYSSDLFIDWENGTCNFMTQDFYDLLNYANSFPTEIDYANYSQWGLLKSGDIKVTNLGLYDITNYQVTKSLVGDNFVIVGYPTNRENGHIVTNYGGFSISEKSNNKEGAWEFLKTLLSEDFQSSSNGSGFPVLKSAFDEMMKKAMVEDGYTDENGNFVVSPKVTWGDGTMEIEVYAATQEEVDEIRKVFEVASATYQYDEKMIEMISEEIEPFFNGQKSAEDIASIIQSRVRIYLAENN